MWQPVDALYGELTLSQRKQIACVSRRHGVNLLGTMSREDWLDQLPFTVAAHIVEID